MLHFTPPTGKSVHCRVLFVKDPYYKQNKTHKSLCTMAALKQIMYYIYYLARRFLAGVFVIISEEWL